MAWVTALYPAAVFEYVVGQGNCICGRFVNPIGDRAETLACVAVELGLLFDKAELPSDGSRFILLGSVVRF